MTPLLLNLPSSFLKQYQTIACLKQDPFCETWLCRCTGSQKKVIVKAARENAGTRRLVHEYHILRRLASCRENHPVFFPLPVVYFRNGDMEILVRSYLEGMTLSDYVQTSLSGPGIPCKEALLLCLDLLLKLQWLHSQDPPVIHRDIKPQNIILSPEGQIFLIDFGLAHSWAAHEEMDTSAFGTRYFAPPEQYGFSQTDARSDIYAAGILLRYCLTQEYKEEADFSVPAGAKRVIRKATQFDPRRRYQTALEMAAAVRRLLPASEAARVLPPGEASYLDNLPSQGSLRSWRAFLRLRIASLRFRTAAVRFVYILSGLLAAAMLGSILFLVLFRRDSVKSYTFREPLIEAAVRSALDRPDGDLSIRELSQVGEIRIFGKQIYTSEDDFLFQGEFTIPLQESYARSELWQENGGISSLEDLAVLTGLHTLCLYRQQIEDITPLADQDIQILGLGLNPLSDLSAIRGNASIRELSIPCLTLKDPGVLSDLPALERLDVSGSSLSRLEFLAGLPLKSLNLMDVTFVDEEKIPEFTALEDLTLSKLYPGLLSQLTHIPLRSLYVTHTAQVSLPDLVPLQSLEKLVYRSGDEPLGEVIPAKPLSFPAMQELDLKHVVLESFAFLEGMPNLIRLGIYDAECRDYEGLDVLPADSLVFCTEDQASAITALYPEHQWKLSIENS